VLAYAEGLQRTAADAPKVIESRAFMRRLLVARIRPFAPMQALAELHRLLVRWGRLSPEAASDAVREWTDRANLITVDEEGFATVLALAADHKFQVFDALILASAAAAACDVLVSEGLQDGFIWSGVRVINPFTSAGAEWLAQLADN
jgi:predicted nucleic acid-binding protein